MGKNIIPQARGKGGPRYTAPSFNYAGDTSLRSIQQQTGQLNGQINGQIIDLVHSAGHSAPLMKVQYSDGVSSLLPAPEGVKIGDKVFAGEGAEQTPGSILSLKEIPEGSQVYNVELRPGDGGVFCKTSGTTAKILSKTAEGVMILLPSKKTKTLHENCRACIGVIAGSGRKEKPFAKAGSVFFAKKARNKLYPRSSACKMNAVDHPFGNKRSARKAKQRPVSRHAPPGRKVGKLAARRTGRK